MFDDESHLGSPDLSAGTRVGCMVPSEPPEEEDEEDEEGEEGGLGPP